MKISINPLFSFLFAFLFACPAFSQHRTALLRDVATSADPIDGNPGLGVPWATPGARTGANGWLVNGKYYLFGGMGTQPYQSFYFADLWEYELSTHVWRYLGGPRGTSLNMGTYGTKGVSASTNWPGGRSGAATWVHQSKLYLFGGSGLSSQSGGGFLNDLWEYDLGTRQWTWLKGSNLNDQPATYGSKHVAASANTPGNRTGFGSWTTGDSLYLFGGVSNSGSRLADLWMYRISTNTWTWLNGPSSGSSFQIPPPNVCDTSYFPFSRGGSMSWELNGTFYLYSGAGAPDDMWEYSPSGNCWQRIQGAGFGTALPRHGRRGVPDTSNTPGSLQSAAAWTAGNKLYLFGGLGSSGPVANWVKGALWSFDPSTRAWTWLHGDSIAGKPGNYIVENLAHPASTPGARYSGACFAAGNEVYLYGGYGCESTGDLLTLSDLWSYDVPANEWRWRGGHFNSAMKDLPGTIGKPSRTTMPALNGDFSDWQIEDTFYVLSPTSSAMWRYTVNDNSWICLRADTNTRPVYGTPGVAALRNVPGARQWAVHWTFNNRFYLFGGATDALNYPLKSLRNDIWEFDPRTMHWRFIGGDTAVNGTAVASASGVFAAANTPAARINSGGAMIGNRFYLYGGLGFDSRKNDLDMNDLWCYDMSIGQWAWLNGSRTSPVRPNYGTLGLASATNNPGSRSRHQVWGIGGKLYVFSGDVYTGLTYPENDLWEYDTSANGWRWIKGSDGSPATRITSYGLLGVPDPSNAPIGRRKAFTWVDSGRLHMFGGLFSGYFNDFWMYDTASNNWTWYAGSTKADSGGFFTRPLEYATGNLPGGRCAGAAFQHDSKVYLLGGYGFPSFNAFRTHQGAAPTPPWRLNDMWAFERCQIPGQCQGSAPRVRITSPQGYDSLVTSCNGAPPVLNAGHPGSRYLWSTGDTTQFITARLAGRYWVTVMPNPSLIGTDTVTVRFSTPPAVSLGNDTSICSNIPYTLSVAQPNVTYSWMDGSTASGWTFHRDSSRDVAVTLENAGCYASDTVRLRALPLPHADSLSVSGSAYQFRFGVYGMLDTDSLTWYFGDGDSSMLPSPAHVYAADGLFDVMLVLKNGCGTDTLRRPLSVSSGNVSVPQVPGRIVVLSPVPANEELRITTGLIAGGHCRIVLYAADGTAVFRDDRAPGAAKIATRHLPAGTYVLTVTISDRTERRVVTIMH